MVEETLLTSILPGSCQCTHFAHQNKQERFHWKFSTKKVAKGLLTGASAEMQVQVQTISPAGRLVRRDLHIYI